MELRFLELLFESLVRAKDFKSEAIRVDYFERAGVANDFRQSIVGENLRKRKKKFS